MTRRYGLRDDQWARMEHLLPGRVGYVGGTARDNRLFVEAVLYRYRAGIPWPDLPARFGKWKSVHQRFGRWAKSGVWERVFVALSADADNEYAMLDATIVRALLVPATMRLLGHWNWWLPAPLRRWLPTALLAAVLIALAFILFASPTPTQAVGPDSADVVKQECQKIVEIDATAGTDLTDLSSLIHICREILAKDATVDTEQQLANNKRGYDFIRFGRSGGGANKKASGSYDYIRFGKRSV